MISKILRNSLVLNSSPSKSVVSAAFVITMAGLASRILGLLRDRFLASTFGAGDVLDVYYAAFRVPDLIYNLLIVGALSAAFIPVFTGLISKEKEEEAWKLANGVLNLTIFCVLVLSFIFAIFAPFIMKIITPGFPEEKMEMVVLFTRIMFLSPLFLGISGIFGGILTSFRKFLIYSLAPLFYNFGIIVGIFVFVKFLGPVGLVWGVVLGAFLHMMIQYPAVRHAGFKYYFVLFQSLKNSEVREVLRLMVPRTLGVAVTQINLVVVTMFASTLAVGSLAVFNFAQNLQSVPLGLFGISFAIAVFPTLSQYAAKEKHDDFVKTFSQTFRQILFFVIPLSVIILVLRAQIVRVVLGSGEFDWSDTRLTFECLAIFVLSLFAQSTIPLLARSFYALKNTKTPFYIALVTEFLNIMAILFLIERFQLLGLVMAFSLASVAQMLMLLFMLRAKFENLDDRNILISVSKISLASFLAGIIVQGSKYIIGSEVDMQTFLGVFSQLIGSAVAGVLGFSFFCYALNLEEFFAFKNSLTRKLFRGKQNIQEDTTQVGGI
ncbi:MAG: integral membrane protein MviN [uncultured bacterium]|nr:MAG: integral membrane protein MviN [uncultured bacterium]